MGPTNEFERRFENVSSDAANDRDGNDALVRVMDDLEDVWRQLTDTVSTQAESADNPCPFNERDRQSILALSNEAAASGPSETARSGDGSIKFRHMLPILAEGYIV